MNLDLTVSGMSCGHCAAAVKSAIAERDAAALVEVDLAAKRVRVHNSQLDRDTLVAAVQEEGYVVDAIQEVA